MVSRIMLADEQTLFREGLEELFSKYTKHKIVASVDNGLDVLEKAKTLNPDLIITDIFLKKVNGIEIARKLLATAQGTKIIALTIANERKIILEAFRAGFNGYLSKICKHDELFEAIDQVLSNQTYLSPEVTNVIVDDFLRDASITVETPCPELSPREREVLQLISQGVNTKKIAARLNISHKTVSSHREKIYKKLKVFSVAEITQYAIREGLVRLS